MLSEEERGTESTAVNTNPAIHTPEEQAVIDEYQAAVDDSILSFINKWEKLQNPDYKRKIRMQIGEVTERAVQDVRRLTGIDVTGFEHSISGGALEHIENRHGKDGKADRSMTDRNDLARIGYVQQFHVIVMRQHITNTGKIVSQKSKRHLLCSRGRPRFQSKADAGRFRLYGKRKRNR